MQRVIKFRAWDKELNCWMKNPMEELMINFYSNSGMPIFMFDQPGTDSLETRGRYIIQQYTGLKDKNGKEIYEGDIVNYTEFNAEHAPIKSGVISIGPDGVVIGTRYIKFSCRHEVIGNIHKNPELLTP